MKQLVDCLKPLLCKKTLLLKYVLYSIHVYCYSAFVFPTNKLMIEAGQREI
jgi:hypothetical protein